MVSRLFSVVKYESVIHEFDPYFNYRVTQFLTKEGFYNLWNWCVLYGAGPVASWALIWLRPGLASAQQQVLMLSALSPFLRQV